MSPILGEVQGDECPECSEALNLEGEFCEGKEIECECGATLVIAKIEAAYTLKMETVALAHDRDVGPAPAAQPPALE